MTSKYLKASEIHHYQVAEAGSILLWILTQQKTCHLSESFVVDGVASTTFAEQIASIPTKVFRFTRNHFNPPLTFSSTVLPCQRASTHSELKIIWDHWDLRCPACQFHASRKFWTIKTANTHSQKYQLKHRGYFETRFLSLRRTHSLTTICHLIGVPWIHPNQLWRRCFVRHSDIGQTQWSCQRLVSWNRKWKSKLGSKFFRWKFQPQNNWSTYSFEKWYSPNH